MSRERASLRGHALFIGCTCLLCAVLLTIFLCYNRYQERQFEVLEHQSLIVEARWQSQQVETVLAKLIGQLDAAADLIVSSELPPEEAWLQDYLDQIGREEAYSISYFSMEELRLELEEKNAPAEAKEAYRLLEAGVAVVSDILHATHLGGYYFAVGEPVCREGETIGALRCVVPAQQLLRQDTGGRRFPFLQCVVNREGKILYSSREELTGEDLLGWLNGQGVRSAATDLLRQALSEGKSDAVTLETDEIHWTLTSVTLFADRGWNLVQLSEGGSYQAVSRRLLGSTILIGALLMLLTLGIAAVVFRLVMGQSRQLELEQQKFLSLASMFGTLFFEYDWQRDLLTLTASERCPFAVRTGSIANCRRHGLESVHPEDAAMLRKAMEKLRTGAVLEIRLLGKGGGWLWCECQVRPLLVNGRPAALAGRIIDVNSRKLRELQLLEKSETDMLTGLLNRASIQAAVDALTAQTSGGFLFMCDLDNFKAINDSRGHAAGDQLLCDAAALLKACFRAKDLVARQGGDEFVVYMAETTDRTLAAAKAEKILREFAQFSQERCLPISASVGIACYPEDGDSFEELFPKADAAMYQAKRRGKQMFCFYRET